MRNKGKPRPRDPSARQPGNHDGQKAGHFTQEKLVKLAEESPKVKCNCTSAIRRTRC